MGLSSVREFHEMLACRSAGHSASADCADSGHVVAVDHVESAG